MTAVLDTPVTPDLTTRGPSIVLPVGALLDALNAVSVAIPARPPVPVLGGMILDVAGDRATLAGFDYETSITVAVDGAGHSGRAVISHAELVKVVKAAVKGDAKRNYADWAVVVETSHHGNDTEADVTVGGFTVPVHCMPVGDYPTIPGWSRDDTITIDRAALAGMLAKVAASVGGDDTLPMLTGVRVELSGGRLTMASTDRFRLAVASVDVDAAAGESGGWLLPFERLQAIVKTLPDGPVTFSVGAVTTERHGQNGWITVRGGEVTATLRVMPQEFPRFRALFPPDVATTVTVDRQALQRTVIKAMALGKAIDTRMGTVSLAVSADRGSVKVAPHVSENADRVRGAELDATVTGAELTFGAGGAYLAEALATFTGDTVALGFTSPTRPVVIGDDVAALTDDQASYRHLLMPVRLG